MWSKGGRFGLIFYKNNTWYSVCTAVVRLVLIGELLFEIFQGLEIFVDMYQDTEAFCHDSRNSAEAKKKKHFF